MSILEEVTKINDILYKNGDEINNITVQDMKRIENTLLTAARKANMYAKAKKHEEVMSSIKTFDIKSIIGNVFQSIHGREYDSYKDQLYIKSIKSACNSDILYNAVRLDKYNNFSLVEMELLDILNDFKEVSSESFFKMYNEII